MKTILVPLDGSALAQQAMAHALGLARSEEAKLLLLGVVEEFPHLDETAFLTTYLSDLSKRLRDAGWSCRWQVLPGIPAEQIVRRAIEESAALVVMASHGRRGLTRWMLGSVTDRVVRHAPCPVVVVRCPQSVSPGNADFALGSALAGTVPTYPRVLVPLDGTAPAEEAVERALALAGEKLTLLGVLDFPPPIFAGEIPLGWAASVDPGLEAKLLKYLERVATPLRERGAVVEVVCRRGPTADEIVAAAESADLVVMASCSRPWMERAVTGSVASRVMHRVGCPLLMLPWSEVGARTVAG